MTCLASGIILYRRDPSGLRLLVLRNAEHRAWGFAKGRRLEGDAHEVENALREVHEETGYEGLALHPGFRAEVDYVVRDADGEYGKRVVYFLAEAPADEPNLSHEHEEILWIAPDAIDATLPYGQLRDLARAALAAAAHDEARNPA
jgi:8-oxo-dGTP pyrophosphatase MutT (NUDIX family)